VAVVGKLVKKIGKRHLYTKREIIHKTVQKCRIHKIESKYAKQENKHKKDITKQVQ
jgi:hypothetical protein